MVIGISGKFRSGKDTVANMIMRFVQPRSGAWKVCRFADRLKAVVATLTGTHVEVNHTDEGKQSVAPGFTHTLGELQQIVGTVLRVHVDPQLWVNTAMESAKSTTADIVFTDVRFPNEVEAIYAMGGVVIRVEGDPTGLRETDARDKTHISETALDDYPFEYVIRNDGTLAELTRKVTRVMDVICAGSGGDGVVGGE